MSDRNLLLLAEVDFLTQFLEDSSVWTTTTSPVSSPRGQTSPRANNNNNNSNYNNNSGGAFNASATSINDSNSSNSDGTPPGSRTNTDAVAVQAPTNAFATTTTTTTTAAVKSAVQDNQNNAATSSSGTAAVADSSTPQQRRRPVSPDRRKSLKDVDSHQQTLLHKTCFDGVYEDVEHLLRLNEIDINAKDKAGWTCLLSAACNGHWRICKLLLKNNVDPSISSFNNSSALHYLAKHLPSQADRNGYTKVFTTLLKRNASVTPNRAGDTPLHAACSVANAVAVQLLLNHGLGFVSVNLPNKADWTPMHFCAREGAIDVAELLIKRGANIESKCTDVDRGAVVMPIDVARQANRTAFVQMISARRREQSKMFRSLFAVDVRKAFALLRDHPYLACVPFDLSMLEEKEAKPSEQQSVIVDSSLEGDLTTPEKSIGRRFIHFIAISMLAQASQKQQQQLDSLVNMRQLFSTIDNSLIDVNVRDGASLTPLHLACLSGDAKLILFLLERGASASYVTSNNDSCLHLVARSRIPQKDKLLTNALRSLVVPLARTTSLSSSSPSVTTSSSSSSASSSSSTISSSTAQNNLGETPLHVAVRFNQEGVIRFLISLPDIDVSHVDNNGRTAAQYAPPKSNIESLLLLKQATK